MKYQLIDISSMRWCTYVVI